MVRDMELKQVDFSVLFCKSKEDKQEEASAIVGCSCGLSIRNDYYTRHINSLNHYNRMVKIRNKGFDGLFGAFDKNDFDFGKKPYDMIPCVCGVTTRRDYLTRHMKSKKHFLKMEGTTFGKKPQDPIKCVCGVTTRRDKLTNHLKTALHRKKLNNISGIVIKILKKSLRIR